MAEIVFNDAAGNGALGWLDPAPATWAGARDSASCNTGPNAPQYGVYSEKPSTYYLFRGFITFLTGDILQNAKSIESATLSLYGRPATNTNNKHVCLVASTQANPTGLVQDDWDQFGTTEFATRIAIADWATGSYNVFTLNASGLAALNTTAGGYTKFCLRISRDVDNDAPGPGANDSVGWRYNEDAGAGEKPKLTVTYTQAATSGFFAFL